MGRRRRRAERAIEEVRERATLAAEAVVEDLEAAGRAKRRTRKSRRGIERSARNAERKLGRFWNRGRFRVHRLRRKAAKRIDYVVNKAKKG